MADVNGSVIIQVDGDTGGFENSIHDATNAAENLGETSTSAIDSLAQTMVAAGIAGKVKDIAAALYDCVETFAAFEQQMSAVQSISGATGEEMAALTELAKEMGATTSFTATEAGQALEYMAMAGWDTQKMMDGLPGIMNLAAASGEDLAMVSDIVTDGLTAFGLSADESAHFADVLAEASARSNTNVGMLGESFKYCAPVAGALGYSIEDTAVALGLMANAGIKGSQSGTALRTMLTNLSKPTKQMAGYMNELGISMTDSSGQVRPLSELLGLLREKFSTLTEAQKAQYAAGIAGKEAMSGLLAIVNTSDEDFQSLTESINDCAGAAEEMAQVRLDNYEGQVTLLKSALDGLKMTIGGQLAPILKQMARGATTAVGALNMLLKVCPPLSAILAGLVASAGAFVAALTGFQMLKLITPMLTAFNAALAANPAGATAIAIVGVVTALGTLTAYCADALDGIGGLNSKMREINETYQESESQTLATAEAANSLIDKLVSLEAQESMTAGEAALYAQTVEKLRALMPELNLEIDRQTGLLVGGAEALRVQTEMWKQNALAQAMQEKYKAVLDEQAEALIDVAEKQLGYNDALATCTDIERQMEEVSKALQEVESDSSLTYEEKTARISELNQRMGELSNQYVTAKDNLNAQEGAMERAQQTADAYNGELAELERTQDALNGKFQETASATEELKNTMDSVQASVARVYEEYQKASDEALASIQKQGSAWEKMADPVRISADTIRDTLKSNTDHWIGYGENVENLKNRNIAGIDEMLASLVDFSDHSSDVLRSLSHLSDDELSGIVDQYYGLMAAQREAADVVAEWETDFTKSIHMIGKSAAEEIGNFDFSDDMKKVGEDAVKGLIDGMGGDSAMSQIKALGERIGKAIEKATRKQIKSNSPSKVFQDIGHDVIDGFELGVEDNTEDLKKTMAESAKDATESFQARADINLETPEMPKLDADMQKELQAAVEDLRLKVAAEVGSVSGKLAASAGAPGGAGGGASTVTNDNGIVINLTYNGSSEPEDVRKISRQIGIEASKEMRRRGVLA